MTSRIDLTGGGISRPPCCAPRRPARCAVVGTYGDSRNSLRAIAGTNRQTGFEPLLRVSSIFIIGGRHRVLRTRPMRVFSISKLATQPLRVGGISMG